MERLLGIEVGCEADSVCWSSQGGGLWAEERQWAGFQECWRGGHPLSNLGGGSHTPGYSVPLEVLGTGERCPVPRTPAL